MTNVVDLLAIAICWVKLRATAITSGEPKERRWRMELGKGLLPEDSESRTSNRKRAQAPTTDKGCAAEHNAARCKRLLHPCSLRSQLPAKNGGHAGNTRAFSGHANEPPTLSCRRPLPSSIRTLALTCCYSYHSNYNSNQSTAQQNVRVTNLFID